MKKTIITFILFTVFSIMTQGQNIKDIDKFKKGAITFTEKMYMEDSSVYHTISFRNLKYRRIIDYKTVVLLNDSIKNQFIEDLKSINKADEMDINRNSYTLHKDGRYIYLYDEDLLGYTWIKPRNVDEYINFLNK